MAVLLAALFVLSAWYPTAVDRVTEAEFWKFEIPTAVFKLPDPFWKLLAPKATLFVFKAPLFHPTPIFVFSLNMEMALDLPFAEMSR